MKHEGSLYTVDPVSESIVLVTKKEKILSVELIFKHAIHKLISVGEPNPIKLWEGGEKNIENVSVIRERLKEWLSKNLIPFEESGECLKLAGQLTINPPYGIDNCISSNEMVLNKIQKLIERMPYFD
nr:gem-associated protein 6-like isoform X2 [Halyomorpha halys]